MIRLFREQDIAGSIPATPIFAASAARIEQESGERREETREDVARSTAVSFPLSAYFRWFAPTYRGCMSWFMRLTVNEESAGSIPAPGALLVGFATEGQADWRRHPSRKRASDEP